MVRVQEIKSDQNSKQAVVNLFADDKTDVTPSMNVIGMPAGVIIGAGSFVLTAAGEGAFMKSDGTWSWV